MLHKDTTYVIDFQSGRKGPLQYDVAALLFQAQAQIPHHQRELLLGEYLQELQNFSLTVAKDFSEYFYPVVMLRLMQVLGAYGKLGLGAGKQYFLDSIPIALNNIRWVNDHQQLCGRLPKLSELLLDL